MRRLFGLASVTLLVLSLTGGCGDSEKDTTPGGGGSQGGGDAGASASASGGDDDGTAGGSESSGGNGTGGDDGGAGTDSTVGGGSQAGTPGAMAGSGGAPVSDGGAAGSASGGAPADPFLTHCQDPEVESGSVCIENVIAAPGAEVDVELWLLLPAACDWSTQFSVIFTFDDENLSFEAAPIEDFYDGPYQCVIAPAQPAGSYSLIWFSDSAINNCPEQLTPGLHAILRATVAADAPAGDYALTISIENVGDNLTQFPVCRSQADQTHWSGVIRVTD